MRETRAPFLVSLAAVVIAGSASAQPAPGTAVGAEVYARTCGRCHAARSPLERSDREWTAIVLHMRVRANLTGTEARAVRGFLLASNGADSETAGTPTVGDTPRGPSIDMSRPADAALAERGRQLLEQNGCGGCHRYGGSVGGRLGPDLRGVLLRRDVDYVIRKLTDPALDTPDTLMPPNALTDAERRAIVEYLRTID